MAATETTSFTAIVGTDKYRDVHSFGDTAEHAIDNCMSKILKRSDPAVNEIIVGFWTPTGVIAKPMNMWMRYTRPA